MNMDQKNYVAKFSCNFIIPKHRLSISDWSDRYRILGGSSVCEPGKWNSKRIRYQAGPLNALLEPGIHMLVLYFSAQMGKTEILNNIILYFACNYPGSNILFVMPNEQMGKDWMRERLAPAVESSPEIKKIFSNDKSVHSWSYQGGVLSTAWSGSATSISSKPIRFLACDEVDRFEKNIEGEGDSLSLAIKRTTAFFNKKIVISGTPTNKNFSQIERFYLQSDMRKYYFPCGDCGHYQYPKWDNVKWDKGKPETAGYSCENCGVIISNRELKKIINEKGEWRKTQNVNSGIAGFHINEISSTWRSLADIAKDFYSKKDNILELKTFINCSLAETWEERNVKVDEGELIQRREDYKVIPLDALVIACGVDIQKNRIEGEVVAYAKNKESWGIEYFVIPGDPLRPEIWEKLDKQLSKMYDHELGLRLKISCTCIDSRYYSDSVYNFCWRKEYRRIFATMGIGTIGAPIVSRPIVVNTKGNIRYNIGVDGGKHEIFGCLKINVPGPGYMHFPKIYDENYFKSLTGEKLVMKDNNNGYTEQRWMKFRRNEMLDCRVLTLAALSILNPNFEAIKRNYFAKANEHDNIIPKNNNICLDDFIRERFKSIGLNNLFR
jgi:phage terminase large subunit GpA-like protein